MSIREYLELFQSTNDMSHNVGIPEEKITALVVKEDQ